MHVHTCPTAKMKWSRLQLMSKNLKICDKRDLNVTESEKGHIVLKKMKSGSESVVYETRIEGNLKPTKSKGPGCCKTIP